MAAKKPQRPPPAEPPAADRASKQPADRPQEDDRAQPVATGISAAAARGAAAGAGQAPAGSGTAPDTGAVAGASAGQEWTLRIDPAAEHEYWRAHYAQRPYARDDLPYEVLASAYEHGWQSASRYGRTATGEPARFEDLEPQLRSDWEAQQRDRAVAWEVAQHATRDAWERVQAAMVEEPAKPSAR